MRLLLIAIVTLSLGASATSAQTGIGGTGPSVAAASLTNMNVLPPLRLLPTAPPRRQSPSRPQAGQGAHDIAVTNCMQMWDSGTHMTKQAWLHTCKRIETCLDNLNIDALMPETKATSQKSSSERKWVR